MAEPEKRLPHASAAVSSSWPTWPALGAPSRSGRPPLGALPALFPCTGAPRSDRSRSRRRALAGPGRRRGCFSRAAGRVPARGREPWAREEARKEEKDETSFHDAAAIFYSNRSYTRTKQERWLESIADAYAALELKPDWTKPYFRIAQV